MGVYFGEASFLSCSMNALLCSVGGGNNHCYDTYRNSLAQGPTLWISPPHLSQINGAVMSTSPCPSVTIQTNESCADSVATFCRTMNLICALFISAINLQVSYKNKLRLLL